MKVLNYALVAGAALIATSPAQAVNIVTNGGFESPDIPGSFAEYGAGSTAITGWTVAAGTVDLTSVPTYVANTPNQALDLFGSSPGTLTQVLNTVIGQIYSVTFAYSHNNLAPSNFNYTGTVNVGGLNAAFSHTGDPTSFSNFAGSFTATGTQTLLSFISGPGTNNGGIFLDDVSVQAVPEPAAWAMMIIGFGLVGGTMRRRRIATRVSFA